MPTLASLDPADASTWIYRNKPVTIELTRSDSTNYQKIETSNADFGAGTLTNVMVQSNSLKLLNQILDNFESDTVGQLPGGWSLWAGTGVTIQSKDTQLAIRRSQYNGRDDILKWDGEGDLAAVDVLVDFNLTHSGGDAAILVRVTGTFADDTCR